MHRKCIKVKEANWYARGRIVLLDPQVILKQEILPQTPFSAFLEDCEKSTNVKPLFLNDNNQLEV